MNVEWRSHDLPLNATFAFGLYCPPANGEHKLSTYFFHNHFYFNMTNFHLIRMKIEASFRSISPTDRWSFEHRLIWRHKRGEIVSFGWILWAVRKRFATSSWSVFCFHSGIASKAKLPFHLNYSHKIILWGALRYVGKLLYRFISVQSFSTFSSDVTQ